MTVLEGSRILVAGSSGFLGRQVSRLLSQRLAKQEINEIVEIVGC